MAEKTIVTTLIEQHRGLQKSLGIVGGLLMTDSRSDIAKIAQLLGQFKKDLTEHLELENGTFYPELIVEMKAKGQNTEKTERFIAEMKDIEKTASIFLEKYEDAQSIEEKVEEFKKEFFNIVEIINIRIEAEEASVYGYWGLF